MAITKTSLRNSVYTTIKQILTDANLTGVNLITSSYTAKEVNMPEIVINNASIDKENFTFDRSQNTNNIVVLIDIYTKQAKQIDTILDEIYNLTTLKKINGMQLIGWTESRDFDNISEQNIHIKTITLTYTLR